MENSQNLVKIILSMGNLVTESMRVSRSGIPSHYTSLIQLTIHYKSHNKVITILGYSFGSDSWVSEISYTIY